MAGGDGGDRPGVPWERPPGGEGGCSSQATLPGEEGDATDGGPSIPVPLHPRATASPCHHVLVPLHPHATMSLCHRGLMPPHRPCATTSPCRCIPMPPRPCATMSPCHRVPVPPFHPVPMPPCSCATASPCHHIPVPPCPRSAGPSRSRRGSSSTWRARSSPAGNLTRQPPAPGRAGAWITSSTASTTGPCRCRR